MIDDDYIIEAFTCGDCWALALHMKRRFAHLTVAVLIEEWTEKNDMWSHAVVYDPSTDTYWDVNGEVDTEDDPWSDFSWEYVHHLDDSEITEYFSDQTRCYTGVPLTDGERVMGYTEALALTA